MFPFLKVILAGELPGVWHHESDSDDHRTFRSALEPSHRTPIASSVFIVVAGFLVAAIRLISGSIPILYDRILPINGSEIIGQFGLKSVAMENGQSSFTH